MSKILVLVGSPLPSDQSVSSRVAMKFVESYKDAHPQDEVEVLNVHELDEIRLTPTILLKNLNDKDMEIINNRQALLEKFKEADKIVVSAPMWNFGLPGAMKEALDAFVVAGETFKYLDAPNEKGEIVKGLTSGKELLFIQAMGGMNEGVNDMAFGQVTAMFNLMGVNNISYFPVQGNDIPGMSQEAEVVKQVQTLAHSF